MALFECFQNQKDRSALKIVVCDDNRTSIERVLKLLSSYFANTDKFYTQTSFTSSDELLAADLSGVDVLFLDVDMPGMNGIETAKQLRTRYYSLYLVFVTGWIEYAPAGYHVNAFRYLLKHHLDDELPRCLDDIFKDMGNSQERVQLQGMEYPLEFPLNDISFLEGSAYRAVKVHTINGEVYECRGKLSEFAVQLEDRGFLRIQKSYIVNMRHVLQIKGYQARLKSGQRLKTSEKDYQSICQRYLLWKGQQL